MTGERLLPDAARDLAANLVGEAVAGSPGLLRIADIDLAPALEQQLFFALRDGTAPPSGRLARFGVGLAARARLAGAAGASLLWWRAPRVGARPLVALIAAPVHADVLLRVEGELRRLGPETITVVRTGRAARATLPQAEAPRLADLLAPWVIRPLVSHARAVRRGLGKATSAWASRLPQERASELRWLVGVELGRIALGALALASLVRRWEPALLIAFDEVGTWARVLPAVGRRFGVPTLDLPHAEAADSVAIRGAGYERMAVYGPRAAAVLRTAGISPERITEIGAPRFDPLLDPPPGAVERDGLRRIVFAAQYVQGAMTRELLDSAFRGARAAAEALAPAELVVVPHPVQPQGLSEAIARAHGAPNGVAVRVSADGLQVELRGAALLVTGWSNSVLEAACLRVPAMTVVPAATSPVDFTADGLALGAEDPKAAGAAARRLLDPRQRAEVVERAHAALAGRIGPLDGRASGRAARIMVEMARGKEAGR